MSLFKKALAWFAPPPDKSADGRDQWPSRTAFILAAMGGCAGMGNLLRYPSQVFNNHGLQWFIPYLMCIFIIAIPALILEIAIGQAYRGGSVIAMNNVNNRLKGAGLAIIFVGFIVGPYFVVNIAWIMNYFRNSFTSPLPWAGRAEEFYLQDVVANVDPIPGSFSEDGTRIVSYTQYPGIALIGETVGWCAFTWFLCWLCIFRGVGLTGRVVYFTMGLPIVITIVIIGRSVSLPNAVDGIKLYMATWRGDQLANGELWQTACGQVFFSIGVGFGYFTSYASYNQKHSNAVMDAILIACSNALFESIAAFAVFGVVGFVGLYPEEGVRLGSFTVGFLTLPTAIVELPAANFWAVMLFFTLMVLGFSSAFAMLDAVVTLVMDTEIWHSRPLVVTALTLISFAFSLPYCTEFGYYLLTGIGMFSAPLEDLILSGSMNRWINDVALVFVVWTECVSSTTLYRWKDVAGQVGMPAFICYNAGFFGAQILGVAVAHAVSPPAGAGVGFGLFIAGTLASVMIAKTPDAAAPSKNAWLSRLWYLAFYSGHQLRNDLNLIVANGKNWNIPVFWAPLLRYISAPILAIVYSFSYPGFYQLREDPLHILGFAVAHLALVIVGLGVIAPRWFDIFIPAARQGEGKLPYAPGVVVDVHDDQSNEMVEAAIEPK